VILTNKTRYQVINASLHRDMNPKMFVQVPLEKLRRTQPLNRLELTSIDRHLSGDQKKRVAKFFREEAAKRTKYAIEPTWTMPESVVAIKTETKIEVKPADPKKEIQINSPANTIVTDSDEIETEDIIEIATSPLTGSSNESESDSDLKSNSPEVDRVKETVQTLWDKNQGAYSQLKDTIFTAKKYMKEFEEMSKTQLKKQLYKEKTRQIKALKQKYRQ